MKRFVILVFFVSFSFAHKLNVFVDYENGSLFVNSYFANGSPCKNCSLKVLSLDGVIITEAKTNDDGDYYKKMPLREVEVVVDAGGGHSAREVFKRDEENITTSSNNTELENIKAENQKLKMKIKSLEKQINLKEFAKIFFALLIIFLIFVILKRIKS